MIAAKTTTKGIVPAALAVALVICANSPSMAAVGYQLGAAANYSDNIARSPGDGTDEVVSNLNAAMLWSNQSPRLSADAFAQLSYLSYFENTFDDEVVPRGDLNIDWTLIPARLSWILEDRFGQIASDPFEAFTPDNIENTNILRTGPDLLFGADATQVLTLSLRMEDQYYEDQAVDNQRLSSALQLKRHMSETRSVALSVYGETVDFDEENAGADYDLYEAFVTFETALSNYAFLLDAGGVAIEIEDETADGLLARLNASRTFDSNWILQLTGEYSYTDSGRRFLIGREQSSAGPGQTVGDENLAVSSSPLRLRMVGFNAGRRTARQELSFDVYWEQEQFELQPALDRTQTGGYLSWEVSLNPVDSISLNGGFKEVRFEGGNREDDRLSAEIRYARKLTESLSLGLRVARVKRTSSDVSQEYDENIVGLSLSFRSDVLRALTRAAP